MIESLFQGDYAPQPMDYRLVTLALLLSFVCGHAMAWLYAVTHSGLSYSRSFVRALVVLPVIVSLVLMVLSNSLVTAFGLMAVLAIVRFRNVLRDTLDTSYLIAVISLGLACGTQRFTTAVIGCVVLGAIFAYLWGTSRAWRGCRPSPPTMNPNHDPAPPPDPHTSRPETNGPAHAVSAAAGVWRRAGGHHPAVA